MNVLIVDDDRFVVAALKKGLGWNSLGFTDVYTAYDIDEAENIIISRHIDLLLSDIDMPHGSGIDLLKWMRDHQNDTPCIFLTNYADFEYAQQAVDLHCFHYFLKPVDYSRLTQVIRDAVQQSIDTSTPDSSRYMVFWHHFFINGDKTDTPYPPDTKILTAFIRFYPWFLTSDDDLKSRLPDKPYDDIHRIFEAVIPTASDTGCMIMEDVPGTDRMFIAIPMGDRDMSSIQMALDEFLSTVIKRLHCPANMYVGSPSEIDSLYDMISKIKDMMRNDLSSYGHLLSINDYTAPTENYTPADSDIINACLDDGRFDDLSDYCHSYLDRLTRRHEMSAMSLESFQIDIVQALYSHLADKGLLANRLYTGEPYHTLSLKSRESVSYMEAYLRYIFDIARKNLSSGSAPKDVVAVIKDYVDEHYMEDINRESLSEILYFDPDYASRLFRKQAGISFTNYVIQKRISEAKKLLTGTTMPISTIASKVGYDNYSYFTRLFKKEVGMTPINYRTDTQAR